MIFNESDLLDPAGSPIELTLLVETEISTDTHFFAIVAYDDEEQERRVVCICI